jgi:hypothetical protein
MTCLTKSLLPAALLSYFAASLAAESWGPGNFVELGKVARVSDGELILVNGRTEHRFRLNKPDEAARLKRYLGAWVKARYHQTNRAGWGNLPAIQEVGVTVRYDAARPFPLKLRGKLSGYRITFGDTLQLGVRLSNRSERTITLGNDRVFAYLTSKQDRHLEVALLSARGRAENPGVTLPRQTLGPGASVEAGMTCTNLIPPGKYWFRLESPPLDGLRILSDAVELEVVSPSREFTEKTLLAWFDRVSSAQQIGIAWILWRDFNNHAGMAKLTAVLDAQPAPWYQTAGIIVAAEGEKGHAAFLRAIRKASDGAQIHYWAEQARQSPECRKLFLALLREDTRIPYGKLNNEPVPIAHLVAQFLLYYTPERKAFPWGASFAERQKVVDRLHRTIRENPRALRLFVEEIFSPDSIDGSIRRGFAWGSF